MKKLVMAMLGLVAMCATADDRPIPADVVPGGLTKSKCAFKVALAGCTLRKLNVDQAIDVVGKAEVKFLGVDLAQLPLASTDEQVDAFKKRLEAAGARPVSYGVVQFENEGDCRRAFEIARRLGAEVVIGVPVGRNEKAKPEEDWRTESKEMIDVAENLVKSFNIKFAIPTLGDDPSRVYRFADQVWRHVEKRDPRMGLCLDIGEEFRVGRSTYDTVWNYHSRIFSLRVRNLSDPSRKAVEMSCPAGAIDIVEIFQRLSERKWAGVAELDWRREAESPLSGVLLSLGYLRGIADGIR